MNDQEAMRTVHDFLAGKISDGRKAEEASKYLDRKTRAESRKAITKAPKELRDLLED